MEDSVLELQTTANTNRYDLVYPGSSPAGFIFRCNTGSNYVNAFRIEVQSENGPVQVLRYNGSTSPGMALEVDTRLGFRKVLQYAKSVGSPMLHNVAIDSVWPQLNPGSNLIRVYSLSEVTDYTITYNVGFGGL